MDVDEILRHVGQTNKFHIILEILLCASLVPTTMTILIPYFAQYNPSWRCVGRNSSICNMKEIMTPSHPNYQDRCRMSRSEWMFTEPKDYSIVTQVGIGGWHYVFYS